MTDEIDDAPPRGDEVSDESWAIGGLPPTTDYAIAQQLMQVQDDPEALYELAVELGVLD